MVTARTLFCGLLVALVLPSQSVFAISAKDFFHEEIEVHSGKVGSSVRAKAVREALGTILIRLSGNRSVLQEKSVIEALRDSSKYLLRYSTATSEERFIDENGNSVPVTRLMLDFDPMAVKQILKSAGLPIWDLHRPRILVWWVVEVDGYRKVLADIDGEFGSSELNRILKKQLVGSSDTANVDVDVLALLQEGRRYGLDLGLPLMDEDDARRVQVETVSGFRIDDIIRASKRYGVDHYIIGRSVHGWDEGWQSAWQWVSPHGIESNQSQAGSVIDLFGRMSERIAVKMSKQYAMVLKEGEGEQFWLEVGYVDSISNYQTIDDYLKSLPNLDQLQLVSVNGSDVCYRVSLKGQVEQFKRIVQQSRKLIEISGLADFASGRDYGDRGNSRRSYGRESDRARDSERDGRRGLGMMASRQRAPVESRTYEEEPQQAQRGFLGYRSKVTANRITEEEERQSDNRDFYEESNREQSDRYNNSGYSRLGDSASSYEVADEPEWEESFVEEAVPADSFDPSRELAALDNPAAEVKASLPEVVTCAGKPLPPVDMYNNQLLKYRVGQR